MKMLYRKRISILYFLFVILSLVFINPSIQKPKSDYHSSQLKEITTKEKNVVRIDYVNEDGEITIAANQGFATRKIITTEMGKIETFFDDKGEPVTQSAGYYQIFREYDDMNNNIRTTFQDAEGKPVTRSDGYSIEEKLYNEKRQIIETRYLGMSGEPVFTKSYGCGKINEYNEKGEICKIIFVDEKRNPVMTERGYAIMKQRYYCHDTDYINKVERELYYDECGKPVKLSLGQYGVHKEYDENGLATVLTYLDMDGNPTITNKGYTTIVREFQANGEIATEKYYDLLGNPFSLSEGQYGINRENGQTTYLDKNGNKMINIKNFLYNQSWVVVFFVLLIVFVSTFLSKKMNSLLLIMYILIIGYMTLMFRESISSKIQVSLFWNYSKIITDNRILVEILRNIWLFIPLGALFYRLYPRKIIIMIPVLISIVIEIIQYLTGIGSCDLDDIVHNGIGAIIGYKMEKIALDDYSELSAAYSLGYKYKSSAN
ncbi:VanZ family protein [Aristaeella hokkaidonensis]|uniref:VanZ family protein n=1 Tax=Aristaeella hokkaidonensis TaxID=3046382 RepID=A0AC61N8E8_9FIRM|nr:VanZ family protein [Aristaeella hokkaidonensis]QUC68206.1 VanZ family protein [Aristaeella hokkaidonensis]SNT95234.1 VanZ like family protein [Aristaeella hokkaidonensis]